MALPEKMKMTTLSQEVIRIMRNISRECKIDERIKSLDKFMTKLKLSGYGKKQREDILKAGVLGYYRKVEREEMGKGHMNRPREEGEEERELDKLLGASNWYKPTEKKYEEEEDTTDI